MSRARRCAVGLTGGLASGKSTVSRHLRLRGVPVLDADEVVHELYGPGQAGASQVACLFGPDVLSEEGAVNRRALRMRIAEDDAARRRLNAAIHPLVRTRIRSWLAELEAAVAVVEAALLVETGSFRSYDLLMVVWCGPEQQLERAVARGMAPAAAQALIAAQAPVSAKLEAADVVVDNRGRPEELAGRIDAAWSEVLTLCRRGG